MFQILLCNFNGCKMHSGCGFHKTCILSIHQVTEDKIAHLYLIWGAYSARWVSRVHKWDFIHNPGGFKVWVEAIQLANLDIWSDLIIWFADHRITFSWAISQVARENGNKTQSMCSTPPNRGCCCHALSGHCILQFIISINLWSSASGSCLDFLQSASASLWNFLTARLTRPLFSHSYFPLHLSLVMTRFQLI